jgi:hypothetical protein
MISLRNINPLLRATGVIGAVAALVTGITFAQLSASASLTNTSENTASAGLNIWNGSAYASTAPGFTITGLIPGTGVNENVYLQNSGGLPEAITATVPTLPTSSGFSGWSNATVSITAQDTSCIDPPGFVENSPTAPSSGSVFTVNTNLADLSSGQVILPCTMNAGDSGNSGVPGTSGNYDFHFDIAESSVTGSSASIGAFNINFTGTQTP